MFVSLLIIALVGACLLWLNYWIAKQFYEVARVKGHYEEKYLWICFFLGTIGYLLVVALPDYSKTRSLANDDLPDL